jgi:hypothetical protein
VENYTKIFQGISRLNLEALYEWISIIGLTGQDHSTKKPDQSSNPTKAPAEI